MKYIGSKNKISKDILSIILKNSNLNYYEPFCGGCNVLDKIHSNKRFANDSNKYLIDMYKELLNGWIPPIYSKEEYYHIKNNKNLYANHIVGWVGFNVSYSGKFFGGYAGLTKTKIGKPRDYQKEAIKNVLSQLKNLQNVNFSNLDYKDFIKTIPKNSIVYCDPPYANVTGYEDSFNHTEFWDEMRLLSQKVDYVYISEYYAPKDFKEIWKKEVKSSLSANGKGGGSKKSIEKLFVYSP